MRGWQVAGLDTDSPGDWSGLSSVSRFACPSTPQPASVVSLA